MIYNMKPIKDFPGYFITREGQVYSMKRKRFLAWGYCRNGNYTRAQISLWKDGKPYNKYVHRLVYETFVGEIPKGYEIDHIDTNPLNNHVDNLRIVTHKENCNNPITLTKKKGNKNSLGKKNASKPIIIDGVEYESGNEASEKLNIPRGTIHTRLNSKNFKNYYYKDDRAC